MNHGLLLLVKLTVGVISLLDSGFLLCNELLLGLLHLMQLAVTVTSMFGSLM